MNKKTVTKLKSFLVTVCSMAVVLSFSIAVPYASEIDENEDISLQASNATAVAFNKVPVDSNSDTSITTRVMTQTKTYAETKISTIYDAHGAVSTEYKKGKSKGNQKWGIFRCNKRRKLETNRYSKCISVSRSKHNHVCDGKQHFKRLYDIRLLDGILIYPLWKNGEGDYVQIAMGIN